MNMAPSATKSRLKQKAFSLVELMLAVFIFTLFSTGVLYLSLDVIQRDAKLPVNNEALLYAQEGLEAARNIRDQNFLLLTTDDHGLTQTSGVWAFDTAPETIDSYYQRTITVADVYRDISGEIAETGTLDPEMKKITSTVTWNWKDVFPKSVSLNTYLSGWTGTEWIQTTCDEFDSGTFTDMTNTETVSPPADNCALQLDLLEETGEFFASADIGEHGHDVVADGNYAYLATNRSSEGLVVVDVSDPDNPTVVAGLDIDGKGRQLTKDGNYLYVGVDDYNDGLAIVDVSTPTSPSLVTSVDLGDDGNGSAVDGNYLYMTSNYDREAFAIYDITNKASPQKLGTVNIDEDTDYVYLHGDYAFLGVDEGDEGFQVINIADPNAPFRVTILDVNDDVNSIDVNGPFAYLGLDDNDDALTVLDISDPENPNIVASIDLEDEIEDLEYLDGYIYAAIDDSNEALSIINVSNPLSPFLALAVDLEGKGEAIDIDGDKVYGGLCTNNRGLVLVNTLAKKYATYGTYVSDALNTGSSDTRYNYLEWEVQASFGTTVTFQIRTGSTEGNLTGATWVGPDGTNATYYETSRTQIMVDPGATGTQYFQFKAYLTSNEINTPDIESVTVNYSP